MSGNTFGQLFAVTTFGESHGPAIGCVIDGCPPRLPLDESDLQPQLDRRRPGKSRHTSMRAESDTVKILSGTYEGLTTGAPIALLINNEDARPGDYADIADRFRPGHADWSWWRKYGIRDPRGGGRSSARETAMRVAAGAVARKLLAERAGVAIHGWLAQLGPHVLPQPQDWSVVDTNPFFCGDAARVDELVAYMDALRKRGDSVGARVGVLARGVPVGLGEPVFDRLEADIGKAMMSINAVKGVEVGDGFAVVTQHGSEHRDEMSPDGFLSNHAGGVLGGVSTGQDIAVSIAVKPTSSIRTPGRTVDVDGKAVEVSVGGRHDPCIGIRAVPVAEAMLALVLADHWLRDRAQNG